MRAVQFAEYGGPEVLQVAEVAEPHAGPAKVRVAAKAASVNPVDWKYREGYMKLGALPYIPGIEVAGVVDEIGDGVSGVAIGDEVFGNSGSGGYAEFVVLSVWQSKPASMSWAEAAGVTVAAETAVRAFGAVGVVDGSTLVVNGASGGVGSAAVQLAVARGIRVIGVAGESNADYLRELGAEPVVYGEHLVERIRQLAPGGVDYAFDVSGSGVIPGLVELTGKPENVVSIADFTAQQYGAKVTSGGEGRSWEALPTVADLYSRGKYRIDIQQVFPLAGAAEAQRISQTGHVRGKLILDVTA